MRAPPPVEFTSLLGRDWRAALSLLVAAAVAVPIAWSLPYAAAYGADVEPGAVFEALAEPAVQAAVALSAAVAAVTAFWRLQRRSGAGGRTLRWDGEDWVLCGRDGGVDRRGDAALMLDLGPWMLVRFRPAAEAPGGATWLPLAMAADAPRWAALRGALWNWRAARGDARP